MREGKRLPVGEVTLEEARQHARTQMALLPDRLRDLAPAAEGHRVEISDRLKSDLEAAERDAGAHGS